MNKSESHQSYKTNDNNKNLKSNINKKCDLIGSGEVTPGNGMNKTCASKIINLYSNDIAVEDNPNFCYTENLSKYKVNNNPVKINREHEKEKQKDKWKESKEPSLIADGMLKMFLLFI